MTQVGETLRRVPLLVEAITVMPSLDKQPSVIQQPTDLLGLGSVNLNRRRPRGVADCIHLLVTIKSCWSVPGRDGGDVKLPQWMPGLSPDHGRRPQKRVGHRE